MSLQTSWPFGDQQKLQSGVKLHTEDYLQRLLILSRDYLQKLSENILTGMAFVEIKNIFPFKEKEPNRSNVKFCCFLKYNIRADSVDQDQTARFFP